MDRSTANKIVLNEGKENLGSHERPLSPILNNGKLNKKQFFGRRHRKLRTKRSIPVIKEVENEQIDQGEQEDQYALPLPDLSVLNNCLNINDKFNKIKEIENQRTKVCNLFYEASNSNDESIIKSNSDVSDFQFQVPTSPVKKKRKPAVKEEKSEFSFQEAGDFALQSLKDFSGLTINDNIKGACGFKTAAGQEIHLPPDFDEVTQRLFNDIFCSNDTQIKSNISSFKSSTLQEQDQGYKVKRRHRKHSPQKNLNTFRNRNIKCSSDSESEHLNSFSQYTLAYQLTKQPFLLKCSTSEEINDTHIIKAAGSLINKLSEHIQMKIDGLEESEKIQDTSFVSEAQNFTKHIEESIARSENISVLSDAADILDNDAQELQKLLGQMTSQNLPRKSSITDLLPDDKMKELQAMALSENNLMLNELSASLTDFCGFEKGEYMQSNKILDLCNKIIDMMNEQISAISSRAQSIISVNTGVPSQSDKFNAAKEAEELFKVNNLKKIVEYCKNKVMKSNNLEEISYDDDGKISKRPNSEKCIRINKKMRMESSPITEINSQNMQNSISKENNDFHKKYSQNNRLLNRIDEVNESNIPTNLNTVTKTNEICTENKAQNMPSVNNLNVINKDTLDKKLDPEVSLLDNKNSDTQLLSGYNNSLKIFDELHRIVENLGKVEFQKNESAGCQTSHTKQNAKAVQVNYRECPDDFQAIESDLKKEKNVGFTSASGKAIEISEDSIKRVKALLKKTLDSPIYPLNSSDDQEVVICKEPLKSDEHLSTSLSKRPASSQTSEESNRPKSIFKYKSRTPTNVLSTQGINSEAGDHVGFDNNQIEKTLREDLEQFKAGIAKSKMLYKEITEPSLKMESSEIVSHLSLEYTSPHSLYGRSEKKEVDTSSQTHDSFFQKDLKLASFKTASNKPLRISEAALTKSNGLLKDVCEMVYKSPLIANKESSTSNILCMVESKNCTQYTNFNNIPTTTKSTTSEIVINPVKPDISVGFKKASGKDVQIDEKALLKSKQIFKDIDEKENLPVHTTETCPANGSYLEAKHKLEKMFTPPRSLAKSGDPQICTPVNNRKETVRPNSGKKRLGVQSSYKQILIPEHKVEKMKQLFENLQDQVVNVRHTPPKKALVFTPNLDDLKPTKMPKSINVIPIEKNDVSLPTSTPVRTSLNSSALKTALDIDKISPIKAKVKTAYSNENQVVPGKNVIFWKRDDDTGNTSSFINKINDELRLQEIRIKVLNERHKAMCQQIYLLEDENNQMRRPTAGALYRRKSEQKKLSLQEVLNFNKNDALKNSRDELFEISPKNAEHVHFYCPWQTSSEGYTSVLHTVDGSTIVPNIKDYVGLPEIKIAFETTPGVEPKLIPLGWINNHFKWIVWKLASMERKYPDIFENCLNVENVMQQMKYRYDREIDKSERPCLRRILEKDDTSVKRMILLVSDIIKVAYNKHELELSDGWYSVKAVIDAPLNSLVLRKKISVGIKIITQCAELLNCEGCHPLQQTDNVRLKVSYNCTKPAHWHAKLGFQKSCLPFPIPLSTVQLEGGIIGCSKLLIARVYPLRYMEKNPDGTCVWRNKRAEEKYVSEWEGTQYGTFEEISYRIQNQYEKELIEERKKITLGKMSFNEISKVHCPKTIFNLMESSTDPDTFKEMLSPSQQTLLIDYQQKVQSDRHQEVQRRIKKELEKLKCSKREVTEVWKLAVFDAYDKSSDKLHIFTIWKPTEDHLHMIKEGRTVLVYNLLPKKSGDLASNSRTRFRCLDEDNLKRFEEINRRVLPISSISYTTGKALSNEFDTVGTIVRLKINDNDQEMWLTDNNLKLLFIKVMEGPKQCCLFDGLNVGQNVAIWNLVTFGLQDKVAQAIANQYTVVSGHPQTAYLREALKKYSEQVTNVNDLVKEADIKVEECIIRSEFLQNRNYTKPLYSSISINASEIFDESSEDNASIPAGLTKTDVAMSLINTEEFC